MFYAAMLFKFIRIQWRSKMEYPLSFVAGIVAQWIGYGANYITMWLMIRAFGTIGAWEPMEVMFLYAMNILAYSMAAPFMLNAANSLPDRVRTGSFDDVLLKPVNSMFYIMTSNITVNYISHFVLSVSIMCVSLFSLGIHFTLLKFLWLLITIVGSTLIHLSAMLLTTAPSLVFVGNNGWRFLYWDMEEFIHYPISIFGRPIQILLTLILPYGFISFYPAQYFLMKNDSMMFPSFFQFLTPAVGIIMFTIASLVWRGCVNRYESTGS